MSFLLLLSLLLQAHRVSPELPADLVAAARRQVGVTVRYDGSYRRLEYPGGDVELDRGVCSDVLIRAYRHVGIDLQVLVHDDMSRGWSEYPHLWGLRQPDANIDHRRVPNLAAFFRRHGATLPTASDPRLYDAGDIVTWRLPGGLPHIGIVSTRPASQAGTRPLVIHNIGAGVQEEDVLFTYSITGHFRYPLFGR
jgi:uncharacterized protein YijF (DUF1287 family)